MAPASTGAATWRELIRQSEVLLPHGANLFVSRKSCCHMARTRSSVGRLAMIMSGLTSFGERHSGDWPRSHRPNRTATDFPSLFRHLLSDFSAGD
eukprot:5186825-Pyramimonas_sp.AAC.1